METNIDVTRIPFSRYGAYISITREKGKDGEPDANELIIQSVRRRFNECSAYSLTFGSNEPEEFTCIATPEVMRVENRRGYETSRRLSEREKPRSKVESICWTRS